jgi:predicted dithiol-disulfide oxidoreductase (DUF899 family)
MFHEKQQSNEKGSTLFLAMVVMGIMLILGVGVATILVHQIRETAVTKKTAVAFYLKETVSDPLFSFTLDTWEELTWSGVEEKLEYKITENEGVNEFAVRIDDDSYYFFGEGDIGGGGGGETPSGGFSIYYENPSAWVDVSMLYGLYDSGGSIVGSWNTIDMTPSGYENWQTYEFPTLDSNGAYLRLGFCETGASSCTTDSEYRVYKYDTDCFFTKPVSSKCNAGATSIYYENLNGWADVSMLYGLYDSGGSIVGSWNTIDMTPSGYENWQTYELPTLDPSGAYLRLGFCETGTPSCTTDSEYRVYKYDTDCFFTKPVFGECN